MQGITDHLGDPVEETPRPHRFGHFVVPPDAHIKGFGSLVKEQEYPYVPNPYAWIGKDDVRTRT